MKFTYEKGLMGLTTALLIFTLGVHAQQSEEPSKSTQKAGTNQQMETPASKDIPKFSDLDVNQDGVLTKAEADSSWLAQNFKHYDLNLDGYINESEYDQAQG